MNSNHTTKPNQTVNRNEPILPIIRDNQKNKTKIENDWISTQSGTESLEQKTKNEKLKYENAILVL